jgi:hypothetical protein
MCFQMILCDHIGVNINGYLLKWSFLRVYKIDSTKTCGSGSATLAFVAIYFLSSLLLSAILLLQQILKGLGGKPLYNVYLDIFRD